MHIHVGLLHLVIVFGGVLLIGTFWRLLAGLLADSAVGQAMAFMY